VCLDIFVFDTTISCNTNLDERCVYIFVFSLYNLAVTVCAFAHSFGSECFKIMLNVYLSA
jgi:hypothetical protein